MTFLLVNDSTSCSEASAEDLGSPVDLPRLSGGGGGHYLPAAAVTGACALHWMPFAAAVSAARAPLGASHEDFRLRAHQLSHELSDAGDGRGPAVFNRSKFEVVFAVKWVDMD